MSGCFVYNNCTLTPFPQLHSRSVEWTPKDPVYDVAKKHLANSTSTQNNNKTEIPVIHVFKMVYKLYAFLGYRQIFICISTQVVYADLDVKPKTNSTPPMQHPVVYALIDESSLASRSVDNNTPCKLYAQVILAAIPTQVNTFPNNHL